MSPASRFALAALAAGLACGPSTVAVDPIFVNGRAVAAAGDSVIAVTVPGANYLLVRRRAGGEPVKVGAGHLQGPVHIEWHGGRWFVSDVENGRAVIAVFGADGALSGRRTLGGLTDTPHQFAVLPDGRVVVESREGSLLALSGDSVATFALTDRSAKTGLLIGAGGGVLHAIPDKWLTLYNEFGRIRWRQPWPWASTAYVSDLVVDAHGRIHVIAGVPRSSTFIVYTLSSQSGEVTRWSTPGPSSTFIVDRLGEIKPDDPRKWTE